MTTESKKSLNINPFTTPVIKDGIEFLMNDQTCSDVILQVNDDTYHLMSMLLIKQSLFFAEKCSGDIEIVSVNESIKIINKRVIKITDSSLKKEAVEQVLRCMYGAKISIINYDLFKVILIFKMSELLEKCFEHMTCDFFLENYLALKDNHHYSSFFEKYFKANIRKFENVTTFTSQLSLEQITSLLSADDLECDEEIVYQIVDKYVSDHCSLPVMQLYTYVRFTLLSINTLVNEVKKNIKIQSSLYNDALEKIVTGQKETPRKYIKNGPHFCVGKHDQKYTGYRLIGDNEVELFRTKIRDFYKKHDGFQSLDDVTGKYLCSENYFLKNDEYIITSAKVNMNKCDMIKFVTLDSKSQIDFLDIKICSGKFTEPAYSHYKSGKIGLFVSNYI